jgi:PAS domain S-box-containing protein
MSGQSRTILALNLLAGLVAVIVAVIVPLGYFSISYQHATGNLEAEAEINSRIISRLINDNPELWIYEQPRLDEILARRPRGGEKEVRRIVDLRGGTVAESVENLPTPFVTRAHDLKDSGRTVARIEISRSLAPLLVRTVMCALLGLLTGLLIFVTLRVLPIRAVIRAEDALRDSEERFRKVFELCPLGMAIVGLDYRPVKVNAMLCSMLGYAEDELEEARLDVLSQPVDGSGIPEHARRLLAGEMAHCQVECRCTRKEGERLWGQLTLSLIRDERTGDPLHFLLMVADVTETRSLELQLRQSQKLEAVGKLAGGIAHDFNNILTVIIGSASLLQMKTDKENPALGHAELILSAAEKAADLTRGLLAFSRRQLIQPQPVNLNHQVREMEKLLPRFIGEDIELRCCLAERELVVMADPSQFDQILMNLVTNARDAMPDGGVLTIETDPVEMTEEYPRTHGFGTPGCYALLSVSDTGCGMDEATQARIFEPFFTTKEVGKGTGLGLAVTYGIVKQHNGYINVYSEPGHGTTFRVYLPLVQQQAVSAARTEPGHTSVGGTETILIAEDNPELRGLAKQIIEEFGYRVIEAVDGQDAVTRFMEHKDTVDLVFMDVIMPKMNGLEAFAEITKIRPFVKVLFTSGYTDDIISAKGYSVTEANFISKPARPQDLLGKIREILSQ